MALTKEQQREIYIAYKQYFHGSYALFRQNKPIKQRISETKHQFIVRDVRRKYTQNVLFQNIQILLSARVFESENIANMYFSPAKQKALPVASTKDQLQGIYVAYKDIFSNNYALLRKEKPVEERINQTKHLPIVRDVYEKYGHEETVKKILLLLFVKAFESEERANIYLSSAPPSPATTPEQNTTQIDTPKPTVMVDKQKETAAPVASEMETKGVAFTNLDQLLGISSSSPETVKDETMRDSTISPPTPESSDAEAEGDNNVGDKNVGPIFTCSSDEFPISVRKSPVSWTEFLTLYTRTNDPTPRTPPISSATSSATSSNLSSDVSSDASSAISSTTSQSSSTPQSYEGTIVPQEANPPLRTQVLILRRLQQVLEVACFEYAEEMMPSVLREMKWTCPEAGELNIWASHFRKKTAILEHRASAYGVDTNFLTILHSCVNIRHFAVHRKELHGAQLLRLAEHAVALCTILKTPGHEHVHTLHVIRDAIKDQLSSLTMFKYQCSARLGETLARVTECRTELLAMEQEVLNWAAKRKTELDVMEQESIRSSRIDFDQQKTVSWESVEALLSNNETPPPIETQAVETQATDASDADSHIRPETLQGGQEDRFEGILSCFPLFPTLEACRDLGQFLRWVIVKAWSVTLITAESLSQNTWISVFWMAVFFMVLLGPYCMGIAHIVRMAHN